MSAEPSSDGPEAGLDFETRQIHAGAVIDAQSKARVTPIYQTAAFVFDSFDDGEERFAGRSPYFGYARSNNPTNAVAAARLADLEGGEDAVLVSSGQAAIATVLNALVESGDDILATEALYEGTREMFASSLKRQGLTVTYLPDDASDEDWAAAVTPRTKAVYTETIPNPLNQVNDLERLARIAHAAGLPLIVDSTIATPYLCRPFEWGADIVVHSTSKWLAGHASVLGGAIVDAGSFDWAAHAERYPQLNEAPRPGAASFVERYGSKAFAAYVKGITVSENGVTVPPTSTFLLLQGIETLSLRMERHVENAQKVAEWLETRPEVGAVHYAGLESSPYRALAQKYLPLGAGSIVSIDLVGGRPAARTFTDALQLISRMTHIGDVRTLALHSASTIHAKLTPAEREAAGITEGLIRLSIGIESARDIIADLERGLVAASVAIGS